MTLSTELYVEVEDVQLAVLTERVRFWQEVFNLDHWSIKVRLVDECEGEPEAAACVLRSADYDMAEIHFNQQMVADQTDLENDITICHELMHIHMRDMDEAVGWALERLDGSVADAARPWLGHESEGIVDRLARVVVQAIGDSATLQE